MASVCRWPAVNANMTAVVVRSMALTPLAVIAHRRWGPKPTASLEGAQAPEGLVGNVLIWTL